jgi:2-desacetyl-2-hydroxyethyl bacteriochlorophyllide A dehydrogenase
MTTMKALVYTAPNEVQYREEPAAQRLSDDEVLLRIDAVGICGSDMHAYHGHDPRRKPGLILGHEFSGEVIEGPYLGKRFTGNPLIACGSCDYCLQGRSNLCSQRTMVGMTRPGAYAETMAIPSKCLVELPAGMDAVKAALTEPAATALHALHMAMKALVRPLAECRVLVIGGGAIGMFTALLLKHYGVKGTVVAEVNALRRASIERYVGCETVDPLAAGAPRENAFELVVDAVGAKATRTAAMLAVRPGGVLMHIGLQDWASEIDMRKLTLAEITLIGTYTYSQMDLRATVALLHAGAFGDTAWVEERPLSAGAQAFSDLDKGRTASAKIVLRPH